MIVLVGDTRSRAIVRRLQQLGWGRLLIDRAVTLYPGEPWGFDNGVYRDHKNKRPFDEDSYRRRLDAMRRFGSPYIAVVPDIVGGGLRSLERSLRWREELPNDWPWYLAVQDGMTAADVAPVLDRFAGIFLGGFNRFKSTARVWCQLAHANGKRFHYGRAGTLRKLEHARQSGCDSLDSAFPLWTNARIEAFARQWRDGPEQLWLDAAA